MQGMFSPKDIIPSVDHTRLRTNCARTGHVCFAQSSIPVRPANVPGPPMHPILTPTFGGHHPAEDLPERTGTTAVEQLAVRTVAREVAAMPASLVVQLALWPDELARWARHTRTDASVVYNALAARKPYRAVRERLAGRLEVTPGALGQLIEARRPLPTSQRDPAAAPPVAPPLAEAAASWTEPPYPAERTGTNPIERRAVATVAREVAAFPASTVVGLALWPETLAAWSRERKLPASVVWAVLAGAPSAPVRDMLARRLAVSLRELGALIDARRQEPAVLRGPTPERATDL